MQSAKDILRDHKVELLRILPLENEIFLAVLEKFQLLADGIGACIRTQNPNHKKVAYFLQHVVERAPDIYLPSLICAMEQSDNLAVRNLAKDMKERGMCIIIMCDNTLSRVNP